MSKFLPYAECYCEENVYKTLEILRDPSTPFDRACAVVISSYGVAKELEKINEWDSAVPYVRFQNSSASVNLMVWDYHVVAAAHSEKTGMWYVIDQDCGLPGCSQKELGEWSSYCVDLQLYIDREVFPEREYTFTQQDRVNLWLQKVRYRVMESDDYLCFLRTDRTHMQVGPSKWQKPPPLWPLIDKCPGWASDEVKKNTTFRLEKLAYSSGANNLVSFINMDNDLIPGVILTRDALKDFFSR